jgi:hypothetical protein
VRNGCGGINLPPSWDQTRSTKSARHLGVRCLLPVIALGLVLAAGAAAFVLTRRAGGVAETLLLMVAALLVLGCPPEFDCVDRAAAPPHVSLLRAAGVLLLIPRRSRLGEAALVVDVPMLALGATLTFCS